MADREVTFDVVGRDRGGKATLDGVRTAADKLGHGLVSVTKAVGKTLAAGALIGGTAAAAMGKQLFDTAVVAEQLGSKARTVFGQDFPKAAKFADQLNERLGLTTLQTQGLLAGFGDLLTPMGFTTNQAESMSQRLGTLTGALSLWSGGTRSAADVGGVLSDALTGEYDSLKGLGVQIDANLIKEELHKQGKDKLTGAALKQAQAQIALDQIYKQSSNAITAYNNHTNKLTETKLRMQSVFGQMKEKLAVQLTPAFIALASLFETRVVPVIQQLADRYGPKLAQVINQLSKGDTSKIGPQFEEIKTALMDMGTAISQVSVKVPDVASVLAVASVAFGFLANHIDLVRKALPFIIAGFAAYKAAQTAANLAALLTIPVKVAEILVNRQLIRSNLELVAAQRAGKVAAVEGAAAEGIATAAKSGGILANIRAAATTVISTVASKAAAVATKVWAAGQWLLNAALTANPIGVVIVVAAALAVGIYALYRRSETFRAGVKVLWELCKLAWDGIKAGFNAMKGVLIQGIGFILRAYLTFVGAILNGAAKAFGWIPGIGDKLKTAAEKFAGFRDSVNRYLDGIQDENVTVRVNIDAPRSISVDGRNYPVKALAGGGVITEPVFGVGRSGQRYLIGENGPEEVVPMRGGGSGRGMTVNVYVTQPLGTPDAIARVVVTAMKTATRRGYRPPPGWATP
jgi:phage-related protein